MSIVEMNKLEQLLGQTRRLLQEQEKERLNGETFNIFTVLKMERRENATHSALLGELLNPCGTHRKGTAFLELFLEEIGYDGELEARDTLVVLEKHVGQKNAENTMGGRIDIFLQDDRGNSICIENKVYAGDQDAQIARYHGHNREKNRVYYLTLDGREPGKASKRDLQAGRDFHLMSYKQEIISWLGKCVELASDAPMLRETIKQYMMLLKGMTKTMDGKEEKQLIELLLNNYDEAEYIALNFERMRGEVRDRLRMDVLQLLEQSLDDRYEAIMGDPITRQFAQVWVRFRGHGDDHLRFGLEPFNGRGFDGKDLFVGLYDPQGGETRMVKGKPVNSGRWLNQQIIKWDGIALNLADGSLIARLHQEAGCMQALAQHIASEAMAFIGRQEEGVLGQVSNWSSADAMAT